MNVEIGQISENRKDTIAKSAIQSLNRYLESPEEKILREHQFDAMGAIRDSLVSGKRSGHIIMPPGGGKTLLYTELAKALGLRTLVLSPTLKILSQSNETFEMFSPDIAVSSYHSASRDLTGQVVNTTYQSVVRLIENGKINPKDFDLVINDEVHLALGEDRHKIHEKFNHALSLGLTATAYFDQLDGYKRRGLIKDDEEWLELFDNCIYEISLEEAMERGINAQADIVMFKTKSQVRNVEIESDGDYNKRDIERELNTQSRNVLTIAMIAGVDEIPSSIYLDEAKKAEIALIHEKIKGQRTAVFGLSINQVNELANELNEAGITAAAVHANVPIHARDKIFEAHASGEIQVILGVDMLRLGWDSPETKVGIYQAPTHSGVVALQEFGRILRPFEDQVATAIQFVDDFENRRTAPILIPNLFDPEYVLKGVVKGNEIHKSGNFRPAKVPVTFRGFEIEGIIEEAKTNDLLRTRFKKESIEEIAELSDRLLTEVALQNPHLSGFALYKELAGMIPRIPVEKQQEALQAVASIDTNISKKGKKALLLMSIGTIIAAIEPFASLRPDENEDLFHSGIESVLQKISNLKSGDNIKIVIYGAAQDGVYKYFKERYDIPIAWMRGVGIEKAVGLARRLKVLLNPNGLSIDNIRSFTDSIVHDYGINQEQVTNLLRYYSDYLSGAENLQDITVTEVIGMELQAITAEELATLSPRTRRVLDQRYGIEGYHEMALREIAKEFHYSSGERIRQIEQKGLRDLRHPSRSRRLKDFLDPENDFPMPIHYDSRDFIDSRTLSEDVMPQLRVDYGKGITDKQTPTGISWTEWVKNKGLKFEDYGSSFWEKEWNLYTEYLLTLPISDAALVQPILHPDWKKRSQNVNTNPSEKKPKKPEVMKLAREVSREGILISSEKLKNVISQLEISNSIGDVHYSSMEWWNLENLKLWVREIEKHGDDSVVHLNLQSVEIRDLIRYGVNTISSAKRRLQTPVYEREGYEFYLDGTYGKRLERAIEEFNREREAELKITRPAKEKESEARSKPSRGLLDHILDSSRNEVGNILYYRLLALRSYLEQGRDIEGQEYSVATRKKNLPIVESYIKERLSKGHNSVINLQIPASQINFLMDIARWYPETGADTITGIRKLLEVPIDQWWYKEQFEGANRKRLIKAISLKE